MKSTTLIPISLVRHKTVKGRFGLYIRLLANSLAGPLFVMKESLVGKKGSKVLIVLFSPQHDIALAKAAEVINNNTTWLGTAKTSMADKSLRIYFGMDILSALKLPPRRRKLWASLDRVAVGEGEVMVLTFKNPPKGR